MEAVNIIKIGGNVVDDEVVLNRFLLDFARLPGLKVLVHGGGKLATRIGETLGIKPNYIDGRRITDDATIDLVTMVYAGLINKKIVAALQAMNCNAIGLTGADANLIPAQKRPVKEIDYGWVGDVQSKTIPAATWTLLLTHLLVPVAAPITHNGEGQLLNTNADTIAQEIAKALSVAYATRLIYTFEKAGVLLDANDETTVIPSLNPASFRQLRNEEKIFAGMIPKLENAFAALESGVSKVIIGKANQLQQLIDGSAGTTIIS